MTRPLLFLVVLAACAPEPPPGTSTTEGVELLAPRRQLIRLSIDLRGVRPSEEALRAIEEDPSRYDAFVDQYLHDPRFGDRMEALFNGTFLTRTGETFFDPSEAGLGGVDRRRLARSLGDEPLKLVRHVIEADLPWSEVVLADYTMADEAVARMWGLPYPDDATGWVQTAYDDGRPMAGVLSSTTLWTRYPSAGANGNRHRANTVSRILLCDDYLARPVSFSRTQIDALVSGDPEDVIRDTPACQSCHSSLDPLSSHFFGFWWEIDGDLVDQTTYRPEDEPLWREVSGKSPGYFGLPTTDLRELAHALAQDDRFYTCATKTVFEGLTQRQLDPDDWSELAVHRAAFDEGGTRIRALVRSIVRSDTYRAGVVTAPGLDARVPTIKLVSPDVLSQVVADATDYRWTLQGADALALNERGLAVLSGGIDGRSVTSPSHDPSVGLVLVQERLAQAAGWHVAAHDLAAGREADPILLHLVAPTDTPESAPEAFDAQIRTLYLDITGLPLPDDAPEPAELAALWARLYSVNRSPVAAWAGVVSVVLRDPTVIFY